MARRITHEEYVSKMKELHPNIEVLGTYSGMSKKVLLRCKTDGYEWSALPLNSIHHKKGCKKCSGNIKTHEDYLREMSELHPNIEVLGEYVNNKTKIKLRCKIDGHEWEATHKSSIGNGSGCPKCNGGVSITHEEYIKRMNDIHPNIEVLGVYTNNKTPVLLRCKNDNYEWETSPGVSLNNKSGCPKCAGNLEKSSVEVIDKIEKKGVKILSEIVDYNGRVKLFCEKHNHTWECSSKAAYISKHCCPKGAGVHRKDNDEYLKQMNELHPNIEVLGEYKNAYSHIPLRCKTDGYEWESSPNMSINRKRGCPKCSSKKTEKEIHDLLILNKHKVEKTKTFDGLIGVGGGLLSYDFYLNVNGENILIERQGEQHERPVKFGGITEKEAIERFEKQKEHDRRKREYAKENGYTLIEIWYHEDYEEKLKQYGLCA